MSNIALELTGVTKRFGGNRVIPGLDLAVPEHQVTALIGPNGAGKTTIFNLVTGLYGADEGNIVFRGEDITARSTEGIFRRGVVRSFQEIRLFERMTVIDNALVGRERGLRSWRKERENREIAMTMLNRFGLADKAAEKAGSLSYAEQKFLSLARALSCEVDLLLLDEPTSGLDGRSLELVISTIKSLHETNQTVLIVEHNLDVVREIADGIVFLDQGRAIATGTSEELFAREDLADLYFGKVES